MLMMNFWKTEDRAEVSVAVLEDVDDRTGLIAQVDIRVGKYKTTNTKTLDSTEEPPEI